MPTAAKNPKATTTQAKPAGASEAKKISQAEVERRAYFLWLKHRQHGRELQDWLQAERELHSAAKKAASAAPAAKAPTAKAQPAKPAAKAPAIKATVSVKPAARAAAPKAAAAKKPAAKSRA